jgi:hypothetical protein
LLKTKGPDCKGMKDKVCLVNTSTRLEPLREDRQADEAVTSSTTTAPVPRAGKGSPELAGGKRPQKKKPPEEEQQPQKKGPPEEVQDCAPVHGAGKGSPELAGGFLRRGRWRKKEDKTKAWSDERHRTKMRKVDELMGVQKRVMTNLNIFRFKEESLLANVEGDKYELVEITIAVRLNLWLPQMWWRSSRRKKHKQVCRANSSSQQTGHLSKNEGQRKLEVFTLDGCKRSMTFQVTAVNKVLASV